LATSEATSAASARYRGPFDPSNECLKDDHAATAVYLRRRRSAAFRT